MADHQDKKDEDGPIPFGWVLDKKEKRNGTIVKSYYCPITEQRFNTYEHLMRYVNYAQKNKLSIYQPNSLFDPDNKGKVLPERRIKGESSSPEQKNKKAKREG